MLHIVVGCEGLAESPVLRGMFAARKRVFVDLLKWSVPVVAGRFEIDQFDDRHAIYLIVTDGAGTHLASTRLLPTTRPHILGSLYPGLCELPLPTGTDTYEITRFCLERSLDARGRRTARDQLVSAIVDFGRAHAIRRFTGVAETGWLQQILAFGWRCRPLGMPQRIEGAHLGALVIDVDAQTPALLARAGIYCGTGQEVRDAA